MHQPCSRSSQPGELDFQSNPQPANFLPFEMKGVGAQLREARETRGWTTKAAAKATKIKEAQLIQIENEEFTRFAAPAYVRGFVRIYAKTLSLNETKVLADLDLMLAAEGDDVYLATSPVHFVPDEARRFFTLRSTVFWIAIFIICSIFGILAIEIHRVIRHGETVARAEKATPADAVATPKAVSEGDAVVAVKAVMVAPPPPGPTPAPAPPPPPPPPPPRSPSRSRTRRASRSRRGPRRGR